MSGRVVTGTGGGRRTPNVDRRPAPAPAMSDHPAWTTITLRCHPRTARLMRDAMDRFYRDGPRPATDPVALAWMFELLVADYLAGPNHPHPGAGLRRLVENRTREDP